ncbi:hypothetical protein [Profundibacter sp.]
MQQSDTEFNPSTPDPRLRGVAGPPFPSLRAGWRRVVRACRKIEDSWIGDLLALLSLVAVVYAFLVMGWVLS